MIRLLLVDDHPVAMAGLTATLADTEDIEIVGSAVSLAEIAPAVAASRPDVVLCDVELGDGRTLNVPRDLGEGAPPVLYFSSYDYPSFIRAAFDGGAAGYLVKSAPLADIVAAIRTVAAGGTSFEWRHLRAARGAPRMPSAREGQVISLVAAGSTNAEIGAELGIDERTVESHLRRLFDRYGAESRTELVKYAVLAGWIDLNR